MLWSCSERSLLFNPLREESVSLIPVIQTSLNVIFGSKHLFMTGQRDNSNKVHLGKPKEFTVFTGVDDKNKKLRPLYDIPYMFEAREFLRKKLIGKKVNVTVDYIRPASPATETVPAFSERTCATVTIGG
ncbi:hypothetical protein STEG23_018404, partial [Scotinomys teguina]